MKQLPTSEPPPLGFVARAQPHLRAQTSELELASPYLHISHLPLFIGPLLSKQSQAPPNTHTHATRCAKRRPQLPSLRLECAAMSGGSGQPKRVRVV